MLSVLLSVPTLVGVAVATQVLASCAAAATPTVGVTIPVAAPSSAATLSQNLVAFSIEQDRWTDWIGTTSPNTFWVNALNNLKGLAGQPPKIRVGADSEDHTTFNSGVSFSQATFPAPSTTVPYPEASTITVGPGFYTASKFLPSGVGGTHMVWGLNFGANNVTNAINEAKSIIQAFQSADVKNAGVTLDALEIGNEADLFKNNGLRSSSYNIAQWTTEWAAFAANVSSAIGMKKGTAPTFMAPSFAESDAGAGGFSPQQAYKDGLLSTSAGSLITIASQHHYSGSFCSGSAGLLSNLMNKATIRGNLTHFNSDISASIAKGLTYVLGETNSYSCHGAPGVSNTAGAAIWLLDYLLQAATLKIREVYLHEGIGYKYNLIQPIALNRSIIDGSAVNPPTPPHVQPTYYTAIAIAEAIGKSGTTTISEISISNSNVAGYAIYQGGTLARAVFLNSQSWPSGSTGTRPSVKVSMLFLAASGTPTTATLKRMKITHADDTAGVTWGGQSYENSGTALVSGSVVTETVNPSTGFVLSATEAVLLTFSS